MISEKDCNIPRSAQKPRLSESIWRQQSAVIQSVGSMGQAAQSDYCCLTLTSCCTWAS